MTQCEVGLWQININPNQMIHLANAELSISCAKVNCLFLLFTVHLPNAEPSICGAIAKTIVCLVLHPSLTCFFTVHLPNREPSICGAIANVGSSDHVDSASNAGVVHASDHLFETNFAIWHMLETSTSNISIFNSILSDMHLITPYHRYKCLYSKSTNSEVILSFGPGAPKQYVKI